MLQETVPMLQDFKFLRIGQNLHTNMGFCRASHKHVAWFSINHPHTNFDSFVSFEHFPDANLPEEVLVSVDGARQSDIATWCY